MVGDCDVDGVAELDVEALGVGEPESVGLTVSDALGFGDGESVGCAPLG